MTLPYATLEYAQSLAHWGKAHFIESWRTPIILREVTAGVFDAAGTYPIAALPAEADIAGGLAELKRLGAVSAVMVVDDIHRPGLDVLKTHFPFFKPFKTHFVCAKGKGEPRFLSGEKLRRVKKKVRAGVIDLKNDWQSWQRLYEHLIEVLSLKGMHAFDERHHRALGELDGFVGIGAWQGDELISAHVWAVDETSAISHLVASSDPGYKLSAAYAVNDFSLQYFADKDVVNFGGGAGFASDENDGLAKFKQGFSNDTASSYLCGAILDAALYEKLTAGKHTQFFPAYRG